MDFSNAPASRPDLRAGLEPDATPLERSIAAGCAVLFATSLAVARAAERGLLPSRPGTGAGPLLTRAGVAALGALALARLVRAWARPTGRAPALFALGLALVALCCLVGGLGGQRALESPAMLVALVVGFFPAVAIAAWRDARRAPAGARVGRRRRGLAAISAASAVGAGCMLGGAFLPHGVWAGLFLAGLALALVGFAVVLSDASEA